MAVINKLEDNTKFISAIEIYKYLYILGAELLNDNNLLFDGLECEVGVSNENFGIYLIDTDLTPIKECFNKYGMEDSIKDNYIIDLEGLILLHTSLCGQNVEKWYENNLCEAKKEMLSKIIQERKIIDFQEQYKSGNKREDFSYFDRAVTPFLSYSFDSEKFLNKCLFNTTGYYKSEYYNDCLIFKWKKKDNPYVIYSFSIDETGYENAIDFYDSNKEIIQQFSHINKNGQNKMIFSNDELYTITFNFYKKVYLDRFSIDVFNKITQVESYMGYTWPEATINMRAIGYENIHKIISCFLADYVKFEKGISDREKRLRRLRSLEALDRYNK